MGCGYTEAAIDGVGHRQHITHIVVAIAHDRLGKVNRNAFSLISTKLNLYPSASDVGRSLSSNSRVWKDWNSWKNRVSVRMTV